MKSELIKQIMVKSGFDPVAIERMGIMPQAEKFAELLVKECMNSIYVEQDNETCIDDWDFRYEAGLTSAILYIENHFEIEL